MANYVPGYQWDFISKKKGFIRCKRPSANQAFEGIPSGEFANWKPWPIDFDMISW